MCCNCNCTNNFGVQNNNFGGFGGGLEDIGFGGLQVLPEHERTAGKIKIFKAEQDRLGGADKVVVGEVTGRRLNYRTLTIHITLKVYINEQGEDNTEAGFDGHIIKDGFIQFDTPAAFYSALTEVGYSDQFVAVDADTGELIESFYSRDWNML